MTTLREAAQQALEALENCTSEHGHRCNRCDSEVDEGGRVVTALRVALEQPEAQPVAWRYFYPDGFWRFSSGRRINGCDPVQSQALFTSPPVQAEKPQGGISDARAREIADAFAGHAGPEISGKGSEQAAQQGEPSDEAIHDIVRSVGLDWHAGFTLNDDEENRYAQLVHAVLALRPAVPAPRFPTMLRKMWSGTEVQAWIDANWLAAPQQGDKR